MLKRSAITTINVILFSVFILFSDAFAIQNSFPKIIKKTAPAVVNIYTEMSANASSNPLNELFKGMPPQIMERFKEYFEMFNMPDNARRKQSLGSGFIISPDGYIVTNYHVVKGADVVRITLQNASNAEPYIAKVVGVDEESDIALLKIDVKHVLPTLSFGNSETFEVGDWVLAIGNPFGLGHTVTAGILSGKGRDIASGPFDNYLQTDASINPGNSGGPLVNMAGEVVGINTAIIANAQGLGFAIPSNTASSIITALRTNGKVDRGWIGVAIQEITPNTVKALNLGEQRGVIISSVVKDSPAYKAGIRTGDIIIQVNDTIIDKASTFLRTIAGYKPKEKVKLVYLRKGAKATALVTLGERTAKNLATSSYSATNPTDTNTAYVNKLVGVTLRKLTEKDRSALGINKSIDGLIITEIDPKKALGGTGIRPGDIIITANTIPLPTVKEFDKIIKESKTRGAVLLQIYRQGNMFFVSIPLK